MYRGSHSKKRTFGDNRDDVSIIYLPERSQLQIFTSILISLTVRHIMQQLIAPYLLQDDGNFTKKLCNVSFDAFGIEPTSLSFKFLSTVALSNNNFGLVIESIETFPHKTADIGRRRRRKRWMQGEYCKRIGRKTLGLDAGRRFPSNSVTIQLCLCHFFFPQRCSFPPYNVVWNTTSLTLIS